MPRATSMIFDPGTFNGGGWVFVRGSRDWSHSNPDRGGVGSFSNCARFSFRRPSGNAKLVRLITRTLRWGSSVTRPRQWLDLVGDQTSPMTRSHRWLDLIGDYTLSATGPRQILNFLSLVHNRNKKTNSGNPGWLGLVGCGASSTPRPRQPIDLIYYWTSSTTRPHP
jgi:hypothetical protein